ncbi:MAG: hypothetical protein GX221_00475 [Candidatus Riflebacteria bacterium]|nr:hypothetical protein [Candidatus Riflebacteria bacterium]
MGTKRTKTTKNFENPQMTQMAADKETNDKILLSTSMIKSHIAQINLLNESF